MSKIENETRRIRCLSCQRVTKHTVLTECSETEDNDEGMWLCRTWQITACAGCGRVTFVASSACSEDWDPQTNTIPEQVVYHPKRDHHTLPIKLLEHTPKNLTRIYREVMEAYNGSSPTLCAAGLRAVVEGICVDRGVKNGPVTDKKTKKVVRRTTLEGKIEGMVEKGLLTRKHADILHKHRFLGNDAVHQLTSPEPDSLKAAIQIVEHTFEGIYELKHTAKRVRRGSR